MGRVWLLACACVLSCSTDVFETDAGTDGAVDSSSAPDAGIESGADAADAGVTCPFKGTLTCMGGTVTHCPILDSCCITAGGATCQNTTTVPCMGADFECLSESDCDGGVGTAGPICCVMNGSAISVLQCPRVISASAKSMCVATGGYSDPNQDRHICNDDNDCITSEHCKAAQLQGTAFGVCE
jgi:hypothetical protein